MPRAFPFCGRARHDQPDGGNARLAALAESRARQAGLGARRGDALEADLLPVRHLPSHRAPALAVRPQSDRVPAEWRKAYNKATALQLDRHARAVLTVAELQSKNAQRQLTLTRSGVKRTRREHAQNVEIDPERSFGRRQIFGKRTQKAEVKRCISSCACVGVSSWCVPLHSVGCANHIGPSARAKV